MKLILLSLIAVFAAVLPLRQAAATRDRIFANGFEPCCRVGGTVAGLSGSGLVVHLLGTGAVSENLTITHNGLFDFVTTIPTGDTYGVTIHGQPAGQTCTVSHAAGTMGTSDVDNVAVTCGASLIWDQGHWDDQPWN